MSFSVRYGLTIAFSISAAILFWGTFACALVSCTNNAQKNAPVEQYLENPKENRYQIVEIDSCEYIFYRGYHETAITHHGNCKFCKARKL